MKWILLLSLSAAAITLEEYEGLLDELSHWNPSWKKGLVEHKLVRHESVKSNSDNFQAKHYWNFISR